MSTLRLALTVALWGVALAANAQQSSAPATIPRPDELEPGVATSSAAAPPSGNTASSAPSGADKSAAAAPSAAPAPAGKQAASKNPARKAGADRVELGTTDITGNRELPKVLYIVPWKRSDLGDLTGKPVNSLLDEVLQPLDRDVFRRENRYYDALKPDQGTPKTGTAQGSANNP